MCTSRWRHGRAEFAIGTPASQRLPLPQLGASQAHGRHPLHLLPSRCPPPEPEAHEQPTSGASLVLNHRIVYLRCRRSTCALPRPCRPCRHELRPQVPPLQPVCGSTSTSSSSSVVPFSSILITAKYPQPEQQPLHAKTPQPVRGRSPHMSTGSVSNDSDFQIVAPASVPSPVNSTLRTSEPNSSSCLRALFSFAASIARPTRNRTHVSPADPSSLNILRAPKGAQQWKKPKVRRRLSEHMSKPGRVTGPEAS